MLLQKFLLHTLLLLALGTFGFCQCSKNPDDTPEPNPEPPAAQPVGIWTTTSSQSSLLAARTLPFATGKDDRFPVIQIDTALKFQTVEGFGYTLTGGSALLIGQLSPGARTTLLRELFGRNVNGIGVSYLRVSMGASDLDPVVFSYHDLPAGQTDPTLAGFNLSRDTLYLIPLLKEILAISPGLKIMASPWSAPVWMKTNGSSVGGSLRPQYYPAYAQYFVKYLQAMQAQGIAIDAVTVQNEPQHGGNNPSMVMSSAQQADFVKNFLGPAFQSAGLATKIIIWDHNCDNPGFPLDVLNDPGAKSFVHGSAFHLYAGDISAMSQVRSAHPDRDVYFTEQWTGANGSFAGDLQWHLRNVIIGSMRNWSRATLEWNLANDPSYGPHTPGGCTECKGALTVNGATVTRNVSYYIIAHASKFVLPGSVRLASNETGALSNVAFRTPEGKTVLIVLNQGSAVQSFNVSAAGKWIVASVEPGAVATLVF